MMRHTKSSSVYCSSDGTVQRYYFPKILYPSLKRYYQAQESWFGFMANTVRQILNNARNGYILDQDYYKGWEEWDSKK